MKPFRFVGLALVALLLVFASASHVMANEYDKDYTVWSIVESSPDHETLEAALECTGLDGALANRGQLTLFAPTDDAFAGLELYPENICESFSTMELANILLTHVAKGRRDSSQVVEYTQIRMVNRVFVEVEVGDEVYLNDARLDLDNLDVGARNGIIHFVEEGLILP